MSRLSSLLSAVGLAVTLLAGSAQAQIASLSAPSVDALLADVERVAPLVGKEDAVKVGKGLLALNLNGVDRTKPFGLYVLWPEKITQLFEIEFPLVYFAPVTDEKRFLASLAKFDVKVEKEDGDTRKLILQGGVELVLRIVNGHAYAATNAKWLKGKLPLPRSFLPADAGRNAVTANVRFDQFPKDYAKLADILSPFLMFATLFADESKKKPGETEEQYKERLAVASQLKKLPEAYRATVTSFVENTESLTVRVGVDPKEEQLSLKMTLKPKPGGIIDTFSQYAGTGKSQFFPLVTKADAGALLHFPPPAERARGPVVLTPDQRGMFANVMNLPGVDREAFTRCLEVIFGTINSEGFNATVLLSILDKDNAAIVLGLKINDGRKLDSALRDLYKNLSTETKKMNVVEWNHARHGTARIHKLQMIGEEEEIYLAIRSDVVFMTFSKESLSFVKASLDNMPAKVTEYSPLLHARTGSRGVLHEPEMRKAADKHLSAMERDKLNADLTVTGGKEMNLTLRVSNALVRVLSRYLEVK